MWKRYLNNASITGEKTSALARNSQLTREFYLTGSFSTIRLPPIQIYLKSNIIYLLSKILQSQQHPTIQPFNSFSIQPVKLNHEIWANKVSNFKYSICHFFRKEGPLSDDVIK